MAVPAPAPPSPLHDEAHRSRLFDAIATLLVDLHRHGIYWGDCSLNNTLFMRDGQAIHAWLVDAETAELHPWLSNGQRQLDLDIMVENVLGGLLDVAARLEVEEDVTEQLVAESEGVVSRYEELWALIHEEPIIGVGDGDQVGARLRRLNDRGFAVEEVRLAAAGGADEKVRLTTAVAGRTFHADELQALTGLDVGEGQAAVLPEGPARPIGPGCGASGRSMYPNGWRLGSGWTKPSRPGPSAPTGRSGDRAIGLRPIATCSRSGGC